MLLVPFPVDIRCRPLHSQHALAGTSHANSQILTAGNPARRIAASLLDRIPLLWATSVLCGVMRCDPAYSRTHPPYPGNRAHTTRSLETAAGGNRNGRKQYRRVYDSQSTTVRFAWRRNVYAWRHGVRASRVENGSKAQMAARAVPPPGKPRNRNRKAKNYLIV